MVGAMELPALRARNRHSQGSLALLPDLEMLAASAPKTRGMAAEEGAQVEWAKPAPLQNAGMAVLATNPTSADRQPTTEEAVEVAPTIPLALLLIHEATAGAAAVGMGAAREVATMGRTAAHVPAAAAAAGARLAPAAAVVAVVVRGSSYSVAVLLEDAAGWVKASQTASHSC